MPINEIIIPVIVIVALLFLAMMFVRNNLVYKIRIKILAECSAKAREAIREGREDWLSEYQPYNNLPPYDCMLWKLNKWTRKQFCG